MTFFDAHRVGPKLWVGSCPVLWADDLRIEERVRPEHLREVSEDLARRGFSLVVLCAEELQEVPLGIPVLKVPLDDSEITRGEYKKALRAASLVTRRRRKGERVLVTCQMGVNRSALVAAMSLMLDGYSASKAVLAVRNNRKPAIGIRPLSNKSFVSALHKLEGMLRPEIAETT